MFTPRILRGFPTGTSANRHPELQPNRVAGQADAEEPPMADPFAPFVTNVDVAQWAQPTPILNTTPPPTGAPVRTLQCATRKPTTAEATAMAAESSSPVDLVVGFAPRPAGSTTRYFSTFDGAVAPGQPVTQITVFEIPPASSQFWICMRSVVVARGFVNEHKLCYCCKAWANVSVEKN